MTAQTSESTATRVAIVTGAGQGIGAAIAERLAQDGLRVVIADLNEETATATADRIGDQAMGVRADITSPDDVAALVSHVLDTWGSIDVLVNNAGWDKVTA